MMTMTMTDGNDRDEEEEMDNSFFPFRFDEYFNISFFFNFSKSVFKR